MGMKLTLAFALSHNPELLVLDEATAGLDPHRPRRGARPAARLHGPRAIAASSCPPISPPTWKRSPTRSSAWTPAASCFGAPKDAITDEAGVARCRAADVTAILDAGFFAPGEARILRHYYGCDVLAPDRFAFARAFPDIPVDKATIEDDMTLTSERENPDESHDRFRLRRPAERHASFFRSCSASAPSLPCSWGTPWAPWWCRRHRRARPVAVHAAVLPVATSTSSTVW